MQQSEKIELIVLVCEKCADILKDPTNGGKHDIDSISRAKSREEAYDHLIIAINTLASIAEFNDGFFEVIDIAKTLGINEKAK